jgi:hypothetical protein
MMRGDPLLAVMAAYLMCLRLLSAARAISSVHNWNMHEGKTLERSAVPQNVIYKMSMTDTVIWVASEA